MKRSSVWEGTPRPLKLRMKIFPLWIMTGMSYQMHRCRIGILLHSMRNLARLILFSQVNKQQSERRSTHP
ncbi:hypothetical protein ACHAW6_001936 [Cyclotella cf. meneghiniana]